MFNKNIKWNKIITHPLFVGIVVALISIWGTHQYDLKTIEYQKSLEENLVVDFLGQHEFIVKPNEKYKFNGILIYNPSSKQISVKEILMYAPKTWFEEKNKSQKQKPQINLPSLPKIGEEEQTKFQPYMEIPSGKIEQMKGFFTLITPSKEDDYYLKFCVITYSSKQFCTRDNLIIHVRMNQTLIYQ